MENLAPKVSPPSPKEVASEAEYQAKEGTHQMIGLWTTRAIHEKDIANLTKELMPLQAQHQMLQELEEEVASKIKSEATLQKIDLKWL